MPGIPLGMTRCNKLVKYPVFYGLTDIKKRLKNIPTNITTYCRHSYKKEIMVVPKNDQF